MVNLVFAADELVLERVKATLLGVHLEGELVLTKYRMMITHGRNVILAQLPHELFDSARATNTDRMLVTGTTGITFDLRIKDAPKWADLLERWGHASDLPEARVITQARRT